jgi:iron complex outermembrane receptor protein
MAPRVRATGNLPMNDISALRDLRHRRAQQGCLRNVLTGEDSVTDNGGLRLRYLLKPNRDLSVNLIGDAANTRSENAVFFAPTVAYASNTAGDHQPLAEFASCGVTVSKTNNQVCSDGPERKRTKVRGLSGQVDWTLGGGSTLTSITAYRTSKQGPNSVNIGMSDTYDKVRNFDPHQNARQVSQELRIASPAKQRSNTWPACSTPIRRTTRTPSPRSCRIPFLPSPPVPRSIATDTTSMRHLTTRALFGQATFHLTEPPPDRRPALHPRHRRATYAVERRGLPASTCPATVKTASGSATRSNRTCLGKLGLQHTVSRDANVYATLSRGYKGPQIDNDTPVNAAAASGATPAISSSRNCRPASNWAPSCPS